MGMMRKLQVRAGCRMGTGGGENLEVPKALIHVHAWLSFLSRIMSTFQRPLIMSIAFFSKQSHVHVISIE